MRINEEKWLNDIVNSGYRLVSISHATFKYVFEPCVQKQNKIITDTSIGTIRIDYRSFYRKAEFDAYVCLFEDSGWRLLYGSTNSGIYYFEKIREDATDDIFSDVNSKAERYKRMSSLFGTFAVIFIPLAISLHTTGSLNLSAILHPKELYLTPGLWKLEGIDFWKAFLFETPFAMGRGLIGYLYIFIIIGYMYYTIKSFILYRKNKNESTK